MARTTFVEHRGKRIARLDFSGIVDEAVALTAIAEAAQVIQSQPPKSLYTVTLVKGSRFNSTVLSQVKKDHGSRAKLIEAILKLEKRAKDAEYKTGLEEHGTPRLFQIYAAAKKRS